jgi:hypothetical protein
MLKTRFIEQLAVLIEAIAEHRGDLCVVFRGKAVIFSELGLILYSDHDLIPCMALARLTRAVSMLQEERHDTSSL